MMKCLAAGKFALVLGLMAACASTVSHAAGPRRDGAENPTILPSSYADVADFAADAATIVDARIRNTTLVEPARAPGLRPGMARLYVTAQVNSVILGHDAVARRVAYLLDVPLGENGRPVRVPKQRVLLFARPVTQANQLVLVDPTAQLPWTPGRDLTVRDIASELAAHSAPPRVTGIVQAFHVRGTVAGESETQIFLATVTGAPVSLSILRRPEQAPHWVAAFGEIVDESSAAPARRTLGWFRLACGLPARIPASVLTGISADDAVAIARDYALVMADVGACDRSAPTTASATPKP